MISIKIPDTQAINQVENMIKYIAYINELVDVVTQNPIDWVVEDEDAIYIPTGDENENGQSDKPRPKSKVFKQEKILKHEDDIQFVTEELKIPVDIGDEILYGKWKNKTGKIKSFEWNEKGDLIATLENGKQIGILKFRIKATKK